MYKYRIINQVFKYLDFKLTLRCSCINSKHLGGVYVEALIYGLLQSPTIITSSRASPVAQDVAHLLLAKPFSSSKGSRIESHAARLETGLVGARTYLLSECCG